MNDKPIFCSYNLDRKYNLKIILPNGDSFLINLDINDNLNIDFSESKIVDNLAKSKTMPCEYDPAPEIATFPVQDGTLHLVDKLIVYVNEKNPESMVLRNERS